MIKFNCENKMKANKCLRRLLSHHFYGGTDTSFCYAIALWFQVFIASLFNGIFTLEMDKERTLFSLFVTVTTNLHQCFYHPFKCIHLVIPYNKITGFIMNGRHTGFFPGISNNIVFNPGHSLVKIKIFGIFSIVKLHFSFCTFNSSKVHWTPMESPLGKSILCKE